VPGGKLAGREGQYRAGFVQRDESLDVARVGPVKEEPAEESGDRGWESRAGDRNRGPAAGIVDRRQRSWWQYVFD
jgi:hypothetical protein